MSQKIILETFFLGGGEVKDIVHVIQNIGHFRGTQNEILPRRKLIPFTEQVLH